MLGGRPGWLIARNLLEPANYRSLWNIRRVSLRPVEDARRYLRGWGQYPYTAAVRTPLGITEPRLFGFHDMVTLSEIFFREDYRASDDIRTVVDVGSNIGLSAMYFLTRHPDVRCRCFEPDPRNVARLRQNLGPFAERVEVYEVAVAETAGELPFGREFSGRYGGLDLESSDTITVTVRDINSILEAALSDSETIDILKIDTEGAELRTISAIEPRLLERVRRIYYEDFSSARLHPDRFDSTRTADTTLMLNRVLSGAGR